MSPPDHQATAERSSRTGGFVLVILAAGVGLVVLATIVRRQRREREDYRPLESDEWMRDCPHCGALNRAAVTFCIECRTRLR